MGLKLIKCNDAMEGELGSVCSNQEPSYTHQQQEKKKQRGSDSETKTSNKGTELKYYGESLTKNLFPTFQFYTETSFTHRDPHFHP